MGHAVDLLDEQTALGRIAKIELHHILLLAADIGRLRCGVDHMAAVAGEFFDDISAFFQPRHGEAAIGGSLVGADDRTACAGGAGQILHLKHSALHRCVRHAVVLPHHQCGEGNIFKG